MRPFTLTARLAMVAAGVLATWLVFASAVGDTAPPRQAPARSGRLVCDPRVPSRRTLARIAFPSATRRMVLRDVAALLQRNCTKPFNDDDDEAIQNDPSAVGGDEGRQMLTSIESLGILAASHFPLRNSWKFSPRSPRGPPVFS